MLKSFVTNLADSHRVRLVVSMAWTLAVTFTLIGALANMIVAQHAQGAVINIGLWEHFNVGAPLTVLSILIGIEWLPEGVAARQPLELCYFRRSRLFKTLVLQGITCPTSSSSPSFGLFRSA